MHGLGLLHEMLLHGCPEMHARRREALVAAVGGMLSSERLTLTEVGRHLAGAAKEKHRIKRVDRLLGNAALHEERQEVYAALCEAVVASGKGWVAVVVDWTPGHAERYLMLEAAVPLKGRAVTVYQQVHDLSRHKNPQVQNDFLRQFKALMPSQAKVVVIADAGFQFNFFQQVEELGWHWVRRLSEPLSVRESGEEDWQRLSELLPEAKTRPRELGEYELSKTHAHCARLCAVRAPKRFRRDRANDREHGHGTMAKRYRKLYSGPWLLASNLPKTDFSVTDIVQLYAQRMQIEETFRDLKSHRYGYAMDYSRSRDRKRLETLRMVGALGMWLQCLVGLAAVAKGLARDFQANTEKRRTVLSWAFLARRLFKARLCAVKMHELRTMMAVLPALTGYLPCNT